MRNVCFFNSVKFWGGGEKLHLEYALEFKKKDYNVFVVCKTNSPLYTKANSYGLDLFGVTVRNLSFLNPLKLLKLVRFYKQEKIDTVIFSGSSDLKLGSISAKLAGVKKIVYLRGLAVPNKSSFANRLIFKYLITDIVTNSLETKRVILKYLGEKINENKIKTIYHGIDITDAKPNENNKIELIEKKGRGIILGNAGRLTKQKGHHFLIKIAKKLKERNLEFTLFIAGTGELQSELEALIEQYNLQNEVILMGFVSDMDSFMNSIDIFLLTSIWEGFGYVLVESMIKSKPVIAFNMTSNPEIVTQNETGFLVEYPDLEVFADKTQLLIEDEALRKQLGNNGKASVINRFNLNDRITEFEYYLLGKEYVQ